MARVLAVGTALPAHRVTAHMPEDAVENKIHEDGLARELGFRGGLVPGVTVYAWMTHPVVAALGREWLERGTFAARFARPVYFEEPVAIEARVAARDAEGIAIETRALNAAGETCATATMALGPAPVSPVPDLAAYPAAPLPAERPPVSREWLASRTVLGTPELALDGAAARAFLDRVSEPLPLYEGPGAPAHPGLYLDLANRALSRNVRVSPWIHVESQGRHLGAARVGERLEMRGKVARLFERKGHEFVELDLLLLAGGARPVAAIRHVAIYQLRGSV
jgi:hypothetical protein